MFSYCLLLSIQHHKENLTAKTILCGDFHSNFEKNDQSYKRLFETINTLEFVDVWHHKYPQKNVLPLCDANNCFKSRIDYIFISKNLVDSTKLILIKIPGTHNRETRMSDHRYIRT